MSRLRRSDFYFGIRRFESVVKEKQPLPIELIAVRPDGKPLDEAVRATLRLTRINWETNRVATAGETSEYESKAQLQVVWERELTTVAGSDDDRKPARATLEQALAEKPGEYLLEAIGKDAGGHDVLTSMVFEVSGEAETGGTIAIRTSSILSPTKRRTSPARPRQFS